MAGSSKEGPGWPSLMCFWLRVYLNPGLFPLRIDVLREVLWQEKHGGKISCPFLHGSRDIKCENSAVGCQSSDSNQSSQCSVRKLLLMWREAGISTISAKEVKVKIEELLTPSGC